MQFHETKKNNIICMLFFAINLASKFKKIEKRFLIYYRVKPQLQIIFLSPGSD